MKKKKDLDTILQEVLETAPSIEGYTIRQLFGIQTGCGVYYLGFKQGVEYIKQRVKAACRFYERYKDKPECLWEEKPEYREKLREMFISHKENGEPYFCEGDYGWEIYDKWLFKESFKSILGEEEK